MKKYLMLAGCLLAALTFCSCGGSSADSSEGTAPADSASASEDDSAVTTAPENASEGGMTLAEPLSTDADGQPRAYATLGDVMQEVDEIKQSYNNVTNYVYLFGRKEHPYRAVAELDEETAKQLSEIDFMDSDRDKKTEDLIKGLKIYRIDDLSEGITPQEALDAFIGKTGQELYDAGYVATGWMDDGTTTTFMLDNGMYEYTAVFEEHVELGGDTKEEDLVKPLTLKSIEYSGLNYLCMNAE